MQKGTVKWLLCTPLNEQTLIGEALIQANDDGKGYPNWAVFCPVCGHIWAREYWDVKRQEGRIHWFVRTKLCPAHPRGGSLMGDSSSELVRTATLPVLLYEFNSLYRALPGHMKPKELQ